MYSNALIHEDSPYCLKVESLLEDYAFVIEALLRGYAHTQEAHYLELAKKLKV